MASVPSKKLSHAMRRLHSGVASLAALPLLVIIITGIILLMRREFDVIHPETRQGSQRGVTLPLDDIERLVKAAYPDEIKSLSDVKELRILPGQGITKVRLKDWREVQLDNTNGTILHEGKKWTSLIIALHEGTFFSLAVSYMIYLPASLLLLVLWISGIVILWGKNKRWKKHRSTTSGINIM